MLQAILRNPQRKRPKAWERSPSSIRYWDQEFSIVDGTLTLTRRPERSVWAPLIGVLLLGVSVVLSVGFYYPLGEGWVDELFDGGVILFCPMAVLFAAAVSGETRWPTLAATLALGAGLTASLGQLAWSGLLLASYGTNVLRLAALRKTDSAPWPLVRNFLREHLLCLCMLAAALLLFEVWEDLLAPGGVRRFAAEFGGWGILLSVLLLLAAANIDSLSALDPVREWQPEKRGRSLVRSLVTALFCFTAFLAVNALTRLPVVQVADNAFSHAIFRGGGTIVNGVMERISSAGGENMSLYGLPLIALALLALRRGRSLQFFAGVMIGAAGVSAAAKALLPRLRPDLVRHRNFDSFPSGHTLSAVVLAGVLVLALLPMARSTWQRCVLWSAGIVWPVLMAASRVYLGRHFLTDVIGGLLLGVAWVAVCRALLIAVVHMGLDRNQPNGPMPSREPFELPTRAA